MMAFTSRLSGAMQPIPGHTPSCATLSMAMIRSRRKHDSVDSVAAVADAAVTRGGGGGRDQSVIILGGGIAGLATARYLLHYARRNDGGGISITLIDKNVDAMTMMMPANDGTPAPSYEERVRRSRPHMNIPSRRNGNYLCPSLTVPWTARPLWKDVIMPALKSALGGGSRPPISFDMQSLIADRNMWSFGAHFLLQKFFLGRAEHQSNKSILEYSMKCLDDPTDELVRSIEYGRWAVGTRNLDGSVHDCDSSGDIDLFCGGLLDGISAEYGDMLDVIAGEEVTMLRVDDGVLRGVTTIDQHGDTRTREADKIVVALGSNSASLCRGIGIPCPVYPVKGHLVTVSSEFDHRHNLTLDGGIGYAAPMACVDSRGRRLYRLSGFVDFTSTRDADNDRIEALVNATRSHLPDLEVIDASACHRPISADDRALIGPASIRLPNLYLATGFGSRGWTIGLGGGKLLASQMLGMPCDIDPTPYLPSRFGLRYK